MSTESVDPRALAGDPIAHRAASDARDRRTLRLAKLKLDYLENKYRHELMDDHERQELRDRILRLRRNAVIEG